MTIVAGEVKWSVVGDVLRIDLSTVLQKDHQNLIRQRDTDTGYFVPLAIFYKM